MPLLLLTPGAWLALRPLALSVAAAAPADAHGAFIFLLCARWPDGTAEQLDEDLDSLLLPAPAPCASSC